MKFTVLGPVSCVVDSERHSPGRAQTRGVLALLLLEAGRTVSPDAIVEAIWGGAAPSTVRAQVRAAMHTIRRLLISLGAGAVLDSGLSGYRFVIATDQLDLLSFDDHVRRAHDALIAGDNARAAHLLQAGLALWQGEPLAGAAGLFVESARAGLTARRLTAVEELADIRLRLGGHVELANELRPLVDAYPMRETLRARLMMALYRSGRQVEALETYRAYRLLLADSEGIDPGAELSDLELAILRQDSRLAPPGDIVRATPPSAEHHPRPERVRPAQLPPAASAFTGRAPFLRLLDDLLTDDDATARTMVITTLAGTAGVGKTALAVHWAHRIADRFPDGQLFADLRGIGTEQPLRPIDALARFLRALGVPGEEIPVDTDAAAGVYRSEIAGRRVLVVLDNAATADQVRPLLPGDPCSLVLVTSRDRLSGLVASHGARRLTLDLLPEKDAHDLLRRVVGPARIDAEPAAVAELIRLCGRLPLALRIAAAHLDDRPDRTISDYVAELVVEGPLAALSIGEDPQAGVRATFDTSYRALGRPEQRMFRLLGLVPGADITPAAAAAIAAIAKQEAAQLLDHLATAHLADQVAPGRFGLHDLLATYARECARQDQANSTAAIGRLLDWYLCHADAAARLLYPHMLRLDVQPAAGGATASLRDDTAALEWLDAEQRNLIAAVLWAATNGHQQVAWLLGDTLRGYFWQSRNTVDWLETAQAGFAAAVDVGDRRAQAAMQINLATANRCVHRYELAIEQYAAAAELASSSGWIEGQAGCIGNLGTIHTSMGNLRSAADCHQEALRLFRKAGQHTGEANALTNLGLTYQLLGQLHDAVDCQEQALELYRNIGSRGGRAHALDNLGELEHALGRLGPAEGHLSQAVALHREVGNRYAEAETLHDLAATQRDAGRDRQALDTAQAGLTLARDIGDRRVEARMLNLLGALKLVAASPRQAIELHRQALRLAKDSDARYPQTEALIGLAAAFGRLDHHEEAIAYAAQALASTHETSYRVLEAQAQSMLAALHLATGDHDAALDHAKRALVICQETGHRLGEARALRLIGDAMSVYKGRETARPDWQRAWAIFADIGVPEANELVNLLSDQG